MRLGRILQRIGVIDRHVELAVDHGGEQRVGAFEQFLAGRDVIVELRARRKQRAVIVEFGEREWTWFRMPRSGCEAAGAGIAGFVTGPEALPKLTNKPRGRRHDSEPGNVVLPTPS